jgi:ATP-dependent Lhr-like helicase
MPLWLQRLKSADLLQAVREFPSFPILVETYRDVLQDAFDMDGLREVLQRLESGQLPVHVVQTALPSPFAQSLQFGFVMDWMYGDDAPRAESRVALLSLDRALLDELLGGEGADRSTLDALDRVLAERRGTAPGRQARDADELAVLVDRAGDVTRNELLQRVAPPADWRRGNPAEALLAGRQLVAIRIAGQERFVLVDALARYAAAFGAASVPSEAGGSAVLTGQAARREVLARFVALSSPFTVAGILDRYPFERAWVEEVLEAWERSDRLVRGVLGGDRATPRWCARRALERARRRELAEARAQVQAVPIEAFASFMQRWQHIAPGHQLTGVDAVTIALRQLAGFARPAAAWERDYLPARIPAYEPHQLDAATASGRTVWAGRKSVTSNAAYVTFFERGTGRTWLPEVVNDRNLGESALLLFDTLAAQGASFIEDLAAATGLGANRLRDALHELAVAGLVTNDAVGAMRDVMRWTPVLPASRGGAPDPARWLPDDFVVQKRVNMRRLAKWKRPDLPGSPTWGGRWSVLRTPGVLGPIPADDTEPAEAIARQWLARYGVVSRDWWRRERPPVGWRTIYRELKRLEFRGDVRRGYFVAGLAGAQFALPEAVEQLRAAPQPDADADDVVAMAASDPANVYALPAQDSAERDPLSRPRGSGAIIVTSGGRIAMTAEGRGSRLRIRPEIDIATVRRALAALVQHLVRQPTATRRRGIVVESIDGEPAASSAYAPALLQSGFRLHPGGVRYHERAG